MRGEFDFNPEKKKLNKTLTFNATKIDKEIMMDMMIDVPNDKTNDEF